MVSGGPGNIAILKLTTFTVPITIFRVVGLGRIAFQVPFGFLFKHWVRGWRDVTCSKLDMHDILGVAETNYHFRVMLVYRVHVDIFRDPRGSVMLSLPVYSLDDEDIWSCYHPGSSEITSTTHV